MVVQFFHRAGPRLTTYFDQPTMVFTATGTTGVIVLTPASRDILPRTGNVNVFGRSP